VFAPDNNAFAKLPAATLKSLLEPQNINELDAVLEYHVVSGAAVYSKDLKPTQNVKTLEGESLLIEVKNGKVTINGKSEVTTADVSASNGVVHIVDTVLIPPSQSCPVSQIPQDLQLEYAFEFQALDSDGDGFLNPAEFKNQGVKLADTFDKYSKSSAGQNWLQRLRGGRRLAASSFSTFWAWLQNRAKEQIDARRAANVFAQFDKNNDKQMSLCEYENAMYTAKQQADIWGNNDDGIVVVHG